MADTAKKSCLSFGLLLCLFCWFGLPPLFTLTNASVAEARTSVSWQRDSMIFNYSLAEVEAVVTDCQNYDKLFPNVSKARKLSRTQCYLEAHIEWMGMKFGRFWMKVELGSRSVDQDGKTVRFKARMLSGSVIHFECTAKLIKLGPKKTKLELAFKADPGLPGVPNSVIEHQARETIREFLVNVNIRLLLGKY